MKPIMLHKTSLLIGILIILLSSCVSQRNVRLLQSAGSLSYDGEKYQNKMNTTYKVQGGDHLYIKVYSIDPKTSKFFHSDFPDVITSTYIYLNSYLVNEQGYISFSFLDQLFVKGMTIEEIRDRLQEKVDEYFKETNVVVKLINFQVTVLGEVENPGTFTIDKDQINVLQAIGMAGGIGEFGKRNKVTLIRHKVDGTEVHYLNLTDKSILESEFYYLMPNDVIYIEPRGSKSFSLSKFPYELSASMMAVAVAILAIFL